ncbi:MAG: hypothetical protein INR73_28425, partial [Williamsia sp.]|nr:hypothetical protein [Williamsia sp.]
DFRRFLSDTHNDTATVEIDYSPVKIVIIRLIFENLADELSHAAQRDYLDMDGQVEYLNAASIPFTTTGVIEENGRDIHRFFFADRSVFTALWEVHPGESQFQVTRESIAARIVRLFSGKNQKAIFEHTKFHHLDYDTEPHSGESYEPQVLTFRDNSRLQISGWDTEIPDQLIELFDEEIVPTEHDKQAFDDSALNEDSGSAQTSDRQAEVGADSEAQADQKTVDNLRESLGDPPAQITVPTELLQPTKPVFTDVWFESKPELVPYFDDIDIYPVRQIDGGTDRQQVEICEPSEAQFWSIYVHDIDGGLHCIADVATEVQASQLASLLLIIRTKYKESE